MQLSADEKQSIRVLILRLVDDLHRVAMQLTGRADAAEELVADTVARASERFRQLHDRAKVKQWLLRILTNTFISTYRQRKSHAVVSLDEHDGENFSLFDQLSVPLLLWGSNPERELINKLLDEDIQKAIAALPEQFRIVVVLCDIEGLTYQEIAESLRIPIGTVRSRIARGRTILQKHLWEYAREAEILPRSHTKALTLQKEQEHEALHT